MIKILGGRSAAPFVVRLVNSALTALDAMPTNFAVTSFDQHTEITINNSTAEQVVRTAGASQYVSCEGLTLSWDSLSADVILTMLSSTGGAEIWQYQIPSGSKGNPAPFVFPVPKTSLVASSLIIKASAAVIANIRLSVSTRLVG